MNEWFGFPTKSKIRLEENFGLEILNFIMRLDAN